jgi:hypothetical protein
VGPRQAAMTDAAPICTTEVPGCRLPVERFVGDMGRYRSNNLIITYYYDVGETQSVAQRMGVLNR